jgi:hypothetical protein
MIVAVSARPIRSSGFPYRVKTHNNNGACHFLRATPFPVRRNAAEAKRDGTSKWRGAAHRVFSSVAGCRLPGSSSIQGDTERQELPINQFNAGILVPELRAACPAADPHRLQDRPLRSKRIK